MLPKVYGDKTEVAVTGANGGPVQSERVTVRSGPDRGRQGISEGYVGGRVIIFQWAISTDPRRMLV